jgi:hypothetical protein
VHTLIEADIYSSDASATEIRKFLLQLQATGTVKTDLGGHANSYVYFRLPILDNSP